MVLRRGLVPVVLAIAAFTSACGGADEPSALPDGVAEADVTFAWSMIPHHRQAVEMADRVIDAGEDSEVEALARRIKDAQGPEIGTMTGWLDDWGRPASGDGSADDSMDGHSMEGHSMEGESSDEAAAGSMAGMMSEAEMAEFDAARGTALDVMFLEMMIRHHEGAVEMARAEVESGEAPAAIALAGAIAESQQAEIDEMRELLAGLRAG